MSTSTETGTGPKPTRRSGGYRHDLDGLRGVAIALVVVFHVWMGIVSGGVDIFLLLSGFFFLGSLLRGAFNPQSSLNPLPHLWRLVRRLYPVLVFIIAVTVGFTMIVQPQTQWSTIFDQAVASLLYFQNWELAWTAQDYAAADAAVSPLQHLWSMSVQGQFYLLALASVLGITALWRLVVRRGSPKWLIVALLVVAGVYSFVHATTGMGDNQPYNYYDTVSRLWEIFLGGLAAVLLIGVVLPAILRFVLTFVGMALIFSTGMVLDGAALFPGPWALYPLGGTLLVIIGGTLPPGEKPRPLRDPITWLLSRRPFVFLGDIAYSLYLWHWPLLIFFLSYNEKSSVSFWEGAMIVAASVVLAVLSERLVERQLRMPSRAKTRFLTPAAAAAAAERGIQVPRRRKVQVAVATSVVAVLGLSTVAMITSWNLTEEERTAVPVYDPMEDPDHPGARAFLEGLPVPQTGRYMPSALQVGNDLPQSTWDRCIADFETAEVVSCIYGDPEAERTVALIGGSHSEHWLAALDTLGRQHGFKVVTVLKMGCPLTLDGSLQDGERLYESCVTWTRDALGAVFALQPDFVFTTSTRPVTSTGPDHTPIQYVNLWEALAAEDIGVLAIRDTPWLNHGRGPVRAGDCLATGRGPVDCGMPRVGTLSEIDPATLAVAGARGVHLLDLTEGLCDPVSCPAVVGNVVTYHDSHHLSQTWVLSATPEIGRQMGIATGWW